MEIIIIRERVALTCILLLIYISIPAPNRVTWALAQVVIELNGSGNIKANHLR